MHSELQRPNVVLEMKPLVIICITSLTIIGVNAVTIVANMFLRGYRYLLQLQRYFKFSLSLLDDR